MAINENTRRHNNAKRVPKSAVFTVTVGLPGGQSLADGVHLLGFIEGNIAISRVMLVVTKAFDGIAPTIDVVGGVDAHFTLAPIDAESVQSSLISDGTTVPLYKEPKIQFNGTIVLGGSTEGELLVVVEYLQLDTEPGLHSHVARP